MDRKCCFDASQYTGFPDTLPCPTAVDIPNVIAELDALLNRNDLIGGAKLLDLLVSRACEAGDWRTELTLQSELMGLHRRTGDKKAAENAVERGLELIRLHRMGGTVSGATVMLNAATTMKFLGSSAEALPIFRHVSRVYSEHLDAHDYRLAGLYNNMALAYQDTGDYESAEKHFFKALSIIRFCNAPENDTAVTWCNLAELYELTGDSAKVEDAIDRAYEYLTVPEVENDGYHAFTLSKCIPTFGRLGFFVYTGELKKRLEACHEGT